MSDLLKLDSKKALVTGAGQGVGRQVALHFAAHGAELVIVNDFNPERAEKVVEEIREAGGNAIAATCDVSDFASVAAMRDRLASAGHQIDILVNNAGNAGPTSDLEHLTPFWESDPGEWQRWFGTNLFGVLNCCRSFVPDMIAKKAGRVVTVVSDAGRVGEGHLAVYSGAKAGAAGFMRGLAKAVAKHQVTVNSVSLGGVITPGVKGLIPDEESLRKAVSHYPLRRLGTPDDAANMILFLSSDAASWITGQTYPVNGGYSFAV